MSYIASDKISCLAFNKMPYPEHSGILKRLSYDTGDRRFSGPGIPGEDHMHGRDLPLRIAAGKLDAADHLPDLCGDGSHSDHAVQFLQSSRFLAAFFPPQKRIHCRNGNDPSRMILARHTAGREDHLSCDLPDRIRPVEAPVPALLLQFRLIQRPDLLVRFI